MRHTAYIALGSNLGDRAAHLQQAVLALRARAGEVAAVSPVYETPALTLAPEDEQPPYFNAVVKLETSFAPEELLETLLDIERIAGRVRRRRWEARPLDLDLILYDDRVLLRENLTLPHPRLAERRFVLQPLHDLAPALRVPAPFEATVAVLLARCQDKSELRQTSVKLLDT